MKTTLNFLSLGFVKLGLELLYPASLRSSSQILAP
jgi:hypothetical protein